MKKAKKSNKEQTMAVKHTITRHMIEVAAAEVLRVGYHPLSKQAIENELRYALQLHGSNFTYSYADQHRFRDSLNEAKGRVPEFYPELAPRRLVKGEWV